MTGGNDNKLNILNGKDYSLILIIKEDNFPESICPKVRSICLHPNGR